LRLWWLYFQPFKVLSTGISISYSHHDPYKFLLHAEDNITVGVLPQNIIP